MGKKPYDAHKPRSCISLESMETGMDYAITLSPPDGRNQDTYKSNEVRIYLDYEKKVTLHKELINKLYGSKLTLYPELSPSGRIHYHGLLIVKDIFQFYYHDLHILESCMYEIDTIGSEREGANDRVKREGAQPSNSQDSDMSKWLEYCQKQKKIMKAVHDRLGMKYPIESGYSKIIKLSEIEE